MERQEVRDRIFKHAKVVPNFGETFGTGGEAYMRFNFGTQHSVVLEAVERMQKAFGDLQ